MRRHGQRGQEDAERSDVNENKSTQDADWSLDHLCTASLPARLKMTATTSWRQLVGLVGRQSTSCDDCTSDGHLRSWHQSGRSRKTAPWAVCCSASNKHEMMTLWASSRICALPWQRDLPPDDRCQTEGANSVGLPWLCGRADAGTLSRIPVH